MLTAMLLKDNTEKLATYHCRGENYYFKQANEFDKETFKITGELPRTDEQLEYVRGHGELADPLGFTSGQQDNRGTVHLPLGGAAPGWFKGNTKTQGQRHRSNFFGAQVREHCLPGDV